MEQRHPVLGESLQPHSRLAAHHKMDQINAGNQCQVHQRRNRGVHWRGRIHAGKDFIGNVDRQLQDSLQGQICLYWYCYQGETRYAEELGPGRYFLDSRGEVQRRICVWNAARAFLDPKKVRRLPLDLLTDLEHGRTRPLYPKTPLQRPSGHSLPHILQPTIMILVDSN